MAAPQFDVVGVGQNATDTLIVVDEYPPYAGKAPFAEERLSPGGQVATAIVACARMGLRTKYIGSIGDDERGRIQRASLQGTGVDTSAVIVRENCSNQTAYIVIDRRTGERTVLWSRPPGLALRQSDLCVADLASTKVLHLDGCDVDAAAWAAAIAKQNGALVSLDVDTVYPDFDRVLRNVDFLIASSVWPGRWTGMSDPFDSLPALREEYGLQLAAMTLGQDGALAFDGRSWCYVPGFEVHCLDTTGAGDVFHGAFCYGVVRGLGWRETLEFANAAAALNCQDFGARGNLATVAEIQRLMSSGARRHSASAIAEGAEKRNSIAVRP